MEIAILQYLPFYVLGILTPIRMMRLPKSVAMKGVLFPLLMLAVLMVLIVRFELPKDWFIYELINFIGIVLLVIAVIIIEKISNAVVLSLFQKLAYASFVAYLLHRTLYKIFKVLFASNEGNIPVYIAPLMVFVLFVISFFVQYYYDKLIKQLHLV